MTKEIIKDPRSSYDIYGYMTNPLTSKKQIILYGWDFNIINEVCIINSCLIDSKLLNKHYKFINETYLEEITPLPRIILTFQGIQLNSSSEGFDNTLFGRYEIEDCSIKIKSIAFMPGRRVVASPVKSAIKTSKYYEESCESFIDELLREENA